MAKASALYDNPRSKGDKEAAATAEADMEKGDRPKADSAAEEATETKAESGEDKGISMMRDHMEKAMDGLKAMMKAHESERRDMHGNHREAMRQMHARHEKQMRDHMEQAMSAASGGAAEAPAEGE